MNIVLATPAIVRILIVFLVVLYAIKKNFSLGYAFLGGAILIGLLFGMSIPAIFVAAFYALIHPKTLSLTVVVCMILVFSHSLEATGQMKRLLDSFRGLIRRPLLNLLVFPALIGLLPMPGGAVFSAPMVKNIGGEQELTSAQLSYINYWFRHIWEYWWPLYPGVLLTTALAGIDIWMFMACSIPLSIVAVSAGYWPLRHSLRHIEARNRNQDTTKNYRVFFRELFPILLVIGVGIGAGVLFSLFFEKGADNISKESGLIFALIIGIAWVWQKNRLRARQRLDILIQPALLKMFIMIASILIFQGLLTESGAVKQISGELLRWHIPLIPVIMILPFIVGGVAGITIAFVGTTFPILISLIQTLGQVHFMLPFMMLAIVCGFVGVLVSPLHLCLILTNTYFEATLSSIYRLMWLPLLALSAAGSTYFFLIRSIFF